MSLEGTIVNGALVFDHPPALPEGTRVDAELSVREEPGPKPTATPTIWEKLLAVAGTVTDMPEDAAAQHDHYLYGTPKR